jgi:hypothetical protein
MPTANLQSQSELRDDLQRYALELLHLVSHRPKQHPLQAGALVSPQEVQTRGR